MGFSWCENQSTCAAFTMARNEKLWLNIWLSHYTAELGERACTIICEPDDPTVDAVRPLFPNVAFIEEPSHKPVMGRGHYDLALEMWRLDVVKRWQTKLLGRFDCVVFSDTDELVVPKQGLLDYCTNVMIPSKKDRARCECWQPVQQTGEPAVVREPGSRILSNRSTMWRLPAYDKTLLIRTPQTYARGFHLTYGYDGTGMQLGNGMKKRIDDQIDVDLQMMHGWRVDIDDWLDDNVWRSGATREKAEEYFKTHEPFFDSNKDPHAVGDPFPVPDEWKRRFVFR